MSIFEGLKQTVPRLWFDKATIQSTEQVVKHHVTYEESVTIAENEFRKNLTITLEEIFNPETSFSQTSVEDKCQYCDYKDLCKK